MKNLAALKKAKKIQILSPDGFTIDFQKSFYKSFDEAMTAFDQWKQRYEGQGYYSSNEGRIPLNDLINHCQFNIRR